MPETSLILIVCTGNLCRSPMAEGLLRQRLAAEGLDDAYDVRSAGTWAVSGRSASRYAEQVMADRGIDITTHVARDLTAKLVAEADLILVMTDAHREAILAEFPDAQPKTYLISQMIDKHYDIADPYGSSRSHYAYCAEDLDSIISAGFDRIIALAGERSDEDQ